MTVDGQPAGPSTRFEVGGDPPGRTTRDVDPLSDLTDYVQTKAARLVPSGVGGSSVDDFNRESIVLRLHGQPDW